MKIKTLTSCFFLAFAISSCIQDEALNSEAAIDGCTGADVQLANINANEKNGFYLEKNRGQKFSTYHFDNSDNKNSFSNVP